MPIRPTTPQEAAYYGAPFVIEDDGGGGLVGFHGAPSPTPDLSEAEAADILSDALALGVGREFDWFGQRVGVVTFMIRALRAARLLLGEGAEFSPEGAHPLETIARIYLHVGVAEGDAALAAYLGSRAGLFGSSIQAGFATSVGTLTVRVALAGTPQAAPALTAGLILGPEGSLFGSPQAAAATAAGTLTTDVSLAGAPQAGHATSAGSIIDPGSSSVFEPGVFAPGVFE